MVISGLKCIDANLVYANCISAIENTSAIYVKELNLYDRVIFTDNFKSKYVCLYAASNTLIVQNSLTGMEDVVFEKTINPQIEPRTYVCIKVGSKCREDLKIKCHLI